VTVKAIRLENFMAFSDTDWLELRPITLLFGRNSSGKSVIIRALRLLRQSLDHVSNMLLLYLLPRMALI
jgi:predicted ATPase